MIVIEHYSTREDGVILNRTYSDQGMMIEREGVRYSEAVDPADMDRRYTETDEPIQKGYFYDPKEATDADYRAALREMGVTV